MKLTNHTLSGVLVLIVLASAPFALSAARHDSPPAAEGGSLDDSMQTLQGDTKKLDKAIEKGDMETVVKLAVEMQKAVWDAKVQVPERAGTITDAKEKAAFVLGFRKQLIQLEKALLDLETAALDGKTDDAKKILNDTIKPMKKEGHSRYKG
jgi:soluble cytochrome b562